jgi:ABC-type sugar transport system substrate-binding protein
MNKMKRKDIFKKFAVCAVSASMIASVTACGKKESSKAPNGKIALICKDTKVAFWEDVKKGVVDACDDFGYEMVYYCATGDNDYASQQEFMNKAIEQKVKAIILAPNDVDALNDYINKADTAGIKVVTINSSVSSDKVASLISSNDTDAGKVAARNTYELLQIANNSENGGTGGRPASKIGIIGHTASTADARIDAFRTEFSSKLADYIDEQRAAIMQQQAAAAEGAEGGDAAAQGQAQGAAQGQEQAAAEGQDASQAQQGGSAMKARSEGETAAMIEQFFIEADRCANSDQAYEAAKKLMDENSDLKIIYTTNTQNTVGACKAVDEYGKSNDIIVVGFNSDEEELKYLRQGTLDGTVIHNPYSMGYVATRTAKNAALGSGDIPAKVDTGVTWVDSSNLNSDIVQLLIYPEKIGGNN